MLTIYWATIKAHYGIYFLKKSDFSPTAPHISAAHIVNYSSYFLPPGGKLSIWNAIFFSENIIFSKWHLKHETLGNRVMNDCI